MIGRLWRVIVGRFGCDHKWTILNRVSVVCSEGDIPSFYDFILQCDRCGNVKGKRL